MIASLSWLVTDLMWVLGALGAGLFLIAISAPMEALGWWGGWYGGGPEARKQRLLAERAAQDPEPGAGSASHYIVYLAGIASVSGDVIAPEERLFLDRLQERYPDAVIVDDVFPYSVNNMALIGNRPFAWAFKLAYALRMRGLVVMSLIINIRNVFQVAVSADPRYGPIYNYGTAGAILESLVAKGYVIGSGTPILMYGYSGGGQMCLGAISYLKRMTQAPISMISMGGVMSSDASLEVTEHLYHLQGEKDWVPQLGALFYPGRWRVKSGSAWNRARREARIDSLPIEAATHFGPKGYLDHESYLSSGESHLDRTTDTVAELIEFMSSRGSEPPPKENS